jgi:sugar phosphate isomerase/epimerase
MRLACSTSAFKSNIADALRAVARLGFNHVDVLANPGWNHILPGQLADKFDETARMLEELLAECSLTPIGLNIALGHLYDRRPAAVAERLAQLKALSALMQRLRIPVAGFYPGYQTAERPWEDLLRDTVASIREMLVIGSAAGVTLAIEPHFATPFQTVPQITRLLEEVPDLMIAYDPSHFVMQGLDLRATAPLLSRTAHVHLRDAGVGKMQMPVGHGTVDFAWLLGALALNDYRGDCAIEYLPDLDGGVEPAILELKALVERLLIVMD